MKDEKFYSSIVKAVKEKNRRNLKAFWFFEPPNSCEIGEMLWKCQIYI